MWKNLTHRYNSLSVEIKAGIWFLICNVIQKGIGVITTPIFTRLMSTGEMGKYYAFQSWREILSIFITLGLSSSVYIKKMVELDDDIEKNKLTCALQGLATTTTGIAFVLYLCFHPFINEIAHLSTTLGVCIFVSVLFTTAYDFWAARQRILYKYRALVLVTLLVAVMRPFLSIIAVNSTAEKAVARIVTMTAVEFAVYSVMYVLNFASRQKPFSKKYWKYALLYVLPLLPHFVSQRIMSQSDRLMISSMVGESATGIYGLALSVGSLLSIVVTSCDSVLAPWVYSNIKENKYTRIREVSIWLLFLMAAFCGAFIVAVPEVTLFFAPKEYHEAIWVIPSIVIHSYFVFLYIFFVYFEYYFENTKSIMVATVMSAGLNVVLNYVFIGIFGYIAAGYTTLVCYIAYTVFHYVVYKKTCKKVGIQTAPYNVKVFILISVGLIVFSLMAMILYPYPYVRYALVACFCIGLIFSRKKIIGLINILRMKGGKT